MKSVFALVCLCAHSAIAAQHIFIDQSNVANAQSDTLSLMERLAISRESAGTRQVRFDGDKVFRIHMNNDASGSLISEILNDNSMGTDLWADGNHWMDIHVPAESIQRVRKTLDEQSVRYFTLIENVQSVIDSHPSVRSFGAMFYNKGQQQFPYDSQWLDLDISQDPFFTAYQSYDSIKTFLDAVVKRFPQLASHVAVGTTYENRDIVGVRLGSASAKSSNKRNHVVFHGGQHSREWIGVAVNCYLIRQLLTGYANDADITQLLDTFEFTIIPVMNPDGYAHTQRNRLWRKNREPTTISYCPGVDSNRNWNFSWATGGSSSNPCSDAYHGPSPFSTREARSIANYINSLAGRVISYIDWHAYSQLWMFPYSYTCKDQPAEAEELHQASLKATSAMQALYGKRFKEGAVCRIIYQASGSSIDWTFANGAKYSFAVELRDTGTYGFLLPADQILPSGEEVLAAVQALYLHVKEQESL